MKRLASSILIILIVLAVMLPSLNNAAVLAATTDTQNIAEAKYPVKSGATVSVLLSSWPSAELVFSGVTKPGSISVTFEYPNDRVDPKFSMHAGQVANLGAVPYTQVDNGGLWLSGPSGGVYHAVGPVAKLSLADLEFNGHSILKLPYQQDLLASLGAKETSVRAFRLTSSGWADVTASLDVIKSCCSIQVNPDTDRNFVSTSIDSVGEDRAGVYVAAIPGTKLVEVLKDKHFHKVRAPLLLSEAGAQTYGIEIANRTFDVTVTGEGVSALSFDDQEKALYIESDGSAGPIEVQFEQELLGGNYTVFIDDQLVDFDITRTESESYILLERPENSTVITINGTSVIPEFPSYALMTSAIVAMVTALILVRYNKLPGIGT